MFNVKQQRHGLDGSITSYEYDKAGRRSRTVSENRITVYTYDETDHVTNITVTGDTAPSLDYTYDKIRQVPWSLKSE